jgi:hypothetical protein
MTKTGRTVLLVVVGLVVCVAIVGVGTAVWFFASALQTVSADEGSASRSFSDIRARFEGSDPILKVTDSGPVITRKPPQASTAGGLKNVQLIAWNPGDEQLATVTLPFWLLRFKSGPITLSAESAVPDVRLSMTVEELERYGPAVWVDHEDGDGSRVLIWTE